MIALAWWACAPGAPPPGDRNVLVLVADDLGVEKLGAYGGTGPRPATPRLDELAARGVRFDRAYAAPLCSPSRAEIQTGRLPWQHGIGSALGNPSKVTLSRDEVTLAEMVTQGTGGRASTSFVGKWHLAADDDELLHAPRDHGYAWFSSTRRNGVRAYDDWPKDVNGEVKDTRAYVTTDEVDDAIGRMEAMSPPWLMVVSFVAPHAPYHDPPPELWSGRPVGETRDEQQYHAAVEALDHEIGRLLDAMDERTRRSTTVVFLADNGTPENVSAGDHHAKGSVYEGGVHVPLLVAGPDVARPGSSSSALVSATDLFATTAELMGIELAPELRERVDSVSLVPYLRDPGRDSLRSVVVQELMRPPGPGPHREAHRMVRDERFKLVQHLGGAEELYDLDGAGEEVDLLGAGPLDAPAEAALARLRAAVDRPLR